MTATAALAPLSLKALGPSRMLTTTQMTQPKRDPVRMWGSSGHLPGHAPLVETGQRIDGMISQPGMMWRILHSLVRW